MHAREPRVKCNQHGKKTVDLPVARKAQDISHINVLGIDEFSVEEHHMYVTLFYDIRNSRVIHIEEGKESDVFGKIITKQSFLDPSK